jgi:hypothetical protein
MAQLSSPGVSVSVIDDSFYTPAAPGTVPLIVVASEESKQNGSSTGIAPGTLKTNAGKVYLLTSQKDLSDTFGTPKFITDASNNPIHAGEQNEYGLQAAYSYLGVSNRAYVVRADVDLAQLTARTAEPTGEPVDGSFWIDTANTKFGVFEWNGASASLNGGQSFTVKYPIVITDTTKVETVNSVPNVPKSSIGSVGSYAIVAVSTLIKLWYKKQLTNTDVAWVEVGSNEWQAAWPTVQGSVSNPSLTTDDTLIINGVTITTASLSGLIAGINGNQVLTAAGITAAAPSGKLEIYSTGTAVAITGGTTITPTNKIGISVATYQSPALTIAPHTQVPQYKSSVDNRPTGSVWIKTTYYNLGADWIIKRYNKNTKAWSALSAPIYSSNTAALAGIDSTGGGINLNINSIYIKTNDSEDSSGLANFKVYRRKGVGATTITSSPITANTFSAIVYSFTISETITGSSNLSSPITITFTGTTNALASAEAILTSINNALVGSNVSASLISSTNQIVISHINGGDLKLVDGANTPLGKLFSTTTTVNYYSDPSGLSNRYVGSLWSSVSDTDNTKGFATPSPTQPTSIAVDGQLWYDSSIYDIDIMIHNGTSWVGYLDASAKTINHAGIPGETDTDPAGPIVSATKPTSQSDGSPLANGDLWISNADINNYPLIYKYNKTLTTWVLVDNSDQTTENGIVFHDARWNATGTTSVKSTIVELLSSNFLDFDAPDPALYPKGMLLWNLRRSGNNVKRFVQNYVNTLGRNPRTNNELMSVYYAHRWVSEAANQEDGSGTFGRKAQRKVVVQGLQSLVNSNQQIRDEESRIFNLIACPGYPELIGELVSLNTDRGLTAFVVGDTPARLTPDATSLSNWGQNVNKAVEDNDTGLVSFDEYLGVFYPWGYTSDNLGNNIVVPPSHLMLRTIALSDNVSYPWFAPAGTRRGGITNATAVGYVDAEGEFQVVALNNGQRDTLQQQCKVNPITFITGSGLVNYGQLTRARNASSLDRINVARLVIYLRRQLSQLAKPYIFEPNDKITRDEIKQAAESLLLELVGQRALYDYVVVCDTSNNTPARIDRNELWLDIAIEPVKAVEFIYIPLRLKNTGEIKALGGA